MAQPPKYTAIICDLVDTLFNVSFKSRTSISSSTLRRITLGSNAWFNYEKGLLSENECYSRIAAEFDLDKNELQHAFDEARDSLQANDKLFTLISELKAEFKGQLRVFAMSNISTRDYEVLREKHAEWSVFDQVFTSSDVGERKPNLGFYRHVLKAADVDPERAIFVDDQFENVFSARSLGMHAIVCKTPEALERDLRNLFGDPVNRGREFLQRNAGHLDCFTQPTERHAAMEIKENWSQLLILEATGDRSLVNYVEFPEKWNFFQGKPQLTTKEYPLDTDTTSLALTILGRDKKIAFPIMDEILVDWVNEDGIILTYCDSERPRFDAGVCVNVLTLFYTHGRGSEVQPTLLWIRDILLYRAYLEGTKYFNAPECLFFLITRLLACSEDRELHGMLHPLLKDRVQERIGAEGDALALAMRILVCDFVGIRNEVDLRRLLPLQCIDGGWEIGWIYRYGLTDISVGNRGLTTALAIKAIEAVDPSLS